MAKFNKEWAKERLKEKSTWLSIIGTVGSAFGLSFYVPAEVLAQVFAALAAGVLGGAGIAAETSKKDK